MPSCKLYNCRSRKNFVAICIAVIFLNLIVFWPNLKKTYTAAIVSGPASVFVRESTSIKNTQTHGLKEVLSKTALVKIDKVVIDDPITLANNYSHLLGKDYIPKTSNASMPLCPYIAPHLIGNLAGMEKDVSMEQIVAVHIGGSMDYTPMELGGMSRPANCRARQKLAIIIPYRNRYVHLHILLNNLLPFLRRQQTDFRIFVIEQNEPGSFNRGMLLNIGFLEALKFQQFDCFVFHDVDMLPINDNAMYTCKDNPLHLAAWTNKWKNGLPYKTYFGGVVMFSREQFLKINGDSNLYFGWGGEDDDLWNRVKLRRYTPIRYPQQIARYKMIKHKRDKGNDNGQERFNLLLNGKKRADIEGLSTTVYNVTKIELFSLYTWIYVTIDKDLIAKPWTKDGLPKSDSD